MIQIVVNFTVFFNDLNSVRKMSYLVILPILSCWKKAFSFVPFERMLQIH